MATAMSSTIRSGARYHNCSMNCCEPTCNCRGHNCYSSEGICYRCFRLAEQDRMVPMYIDPDQASLVKQQENGIFVWKNSEPVPS